ncbi:MAG: hypothetical protein KY468_14090 [Armatimonadetes bacterium]|nr:hypothetical protein [Armatimonadota bacterium]
MPRTFLPRILLLGALPLAALSVPTQNAPGAPANPPASSPPASKPGSRLLEYTADRILVYPRGEGRIFVLSGHAHLKEGDTHFHADRIEYDEQAKRAVAVRDPQLKNQSIGNPVVKDELHTLTADRMTLDFSSRDPAKKFVSAIGKVHFVAKPDPKAGEKAKDERSGNEILPRRVKEESVLTSDRLDYFYRSKRAVAEGNLKLVQGKRWLTGNQAIYYKRYETVVVNGNVRGEDEKGRTFAAENMKVVLNGDTETIEANRFTGTFMLEDEEETGAPVPESPEDRPMPFPGSDEAGPSPAPTPAPEAR